MNIMYIENDDNIIKIFIEQLKNTYHEVFIVDKFEDALVFIKETKVLDLVILGLNFSETDNLNYVREIRRVSVNLKIIYYAENEPKLSFSDFKFLNISKFLKKPIDISSYKDLIFEIENEIECTKYKSNEVFLLENKSLKLINEEIKLSLKSFKEFLFYTETDLNGVITEISDSFCDLLGYKNYQLIGKKHSIIKDQFENPMKYVDIWQNITIGNIWIGELRCIDKHGKNIWYKTFIFPKKDKSQKIVAYGARRQDITDKKIAEEKSITDDLTNLYNKRYFNLMFESERNRAKRDKNNLIFLMIDIDNFKKFNDRYGHLEGDKTLKKVSRILKNITNRANDFVFRLGGEEFGIITSNSFFQNILEYAEKIRITVSNKKIVHIDNLDIGFITVSIGVFICEPQKDYSCNEIYKFADDALYEAKRTGRNKVVFYNNSKFPKLKS